MRVGLPAVFASLLGRSSLWSLPGENFRFGLRSCKQPFPVSLAQLRSPWRVRDRANGPRARREWSGEIHARSDSYHVAWSAMAERWCRFYRSRGLNCRGGRCTRRHAALYFCTTIPKNKRELESRKATTCVGRSFRVLVPARKWEPPRRAASGVKAAGARRKTARSRAAGRESRLP